MYNIDTGDISDMSKIDYFVISMSKCGSTSMFYALNRIKHRSALHHHSDFTLFRVFNDDKITTNYLINERSKIDKPFYILVPYREPISRKISQYYEYGMATGKDIDTIKEEIKLYCMEDYSLFNKGTFTEINEELFYGQDYMSHNKYFDKYNGYSITKSNNRNTILYTLENTSRLEKYLQYIIHPDFKLLVDRKTIDSNHFEDVKNTIRFTDDELDRVYSSVWCDYFYTTRQVDEFKARYRI